MNNLMNLYAEQSVIGCMMIKPDLIGQIAGQLEADCFCDSICRDLFLILQSNSARGRDCDPLALSVTREHLSGGEHTLSAAYEIFKNVAGATAFQNYVDEVKEKARLRKCLQAAEDMAKRIKAGGINSEQAISESQNRLVDLATNSKTENRICFAREGMQEVIQHIQRRMDEGIAIDGLSTGFHDLDRVVEGLRGGMTMILAGGRHQGRQRLA